LLQGRYRVIKLLGKGGFGKTFEVKDGSTLKVLKVLRNNYHKVIELFEREAKILSHLRHPGIPRVEPDGYFTWSKDSPEPLHCLVMEKIDGQNLQEWLSGNQPITQAQALDWLKQLVEILAQVHQQNYFHRDIKPANIMLRPDGQLTLIDFGAVREITESYLKDVEGKDVTQLISAGYTPPEQYEGAAVPQSDFFALGRTMVHLLTGQPPRSLKDPQTGELIWRVHAPSVCEPLADLIDDLMAGSLDQRPQDTQVILQRLKKITSVPSRLALDLNRLTKGWRDTRGVRDKGQSVKFGLAALFLLGLGFVSWRLALPRIAIALNNRGFGNYLVARPLQAQKNFELAVQLDRENAAAYYNQGWHCEDARDFVCAREKYRRAALLGMAAAYSNLARLSIVLDKDYTAAANLSQQGLKLVKDDRVKYTLLKNLGWARLRQRRYREANVHLQSAIALAGNRAAAHCLLAQVLEAQNDLKGTQGQWETCRQYADVQNPDEDVWMGMAQQRLAAGGKEQ
jgi:tetratricopeptide (TPR) repeat protein/predicted Ser/Thr protein kinase